MSNIYRHIIYMPAILLMATTACNGPSADNTLQYQRRQVEDSIGAGYDSAAVASIHRKLTAATDSDTYYLWTASLNKAYFSQLKVDSMTIAIQRMGNYLNRNTKKKNPNIDRLRAEFYLAKGVYNSAILGRPDSAQQYNNKAITILRQTIKDPEQTLIALTNRADIYRQTGQLDLSADAYLQALALADSMETNHNGRIAVMLGIGTTYTFMADYNNSQQWWKRMEKLVPKMLTADKFIYYNNRGNDYYLQDKYRQALPYFIKAANTVKGDPKHTWDYYTVQANLGEIYACLHQIEKAQTAIHAADSFFCKVGFDIALYYTYTTKMKIAMLKGNRTQALKMAQGSTTPAYMIPAAVVQRLKTKEEILQRAGLKAEAYATHLQMHAINDSIQTANAQMRMNTNLLQYRHDKQIAQQQHTIDQQHYISLLAWSLFGLTLATVVVLSILILLFRRRRQIREMQTRNEIIKLRMKNTRNRISPHFIYNALNHEMLAQMNGHDVNLNSLTQLLRRGVERADALVTTLSEEIEFVDYYVNIEAQQMGTGFSYTTHIAPDANPKQIKLPAMVVQIFAENAIKHGLRPMKADSKRRLDITVTRQNGTATHIEVRDNGVGLSGSVKEHTGMKVVRQTIQILNDHNKEKITFGVANYTADNGTSGCLSWITVPDEYNYNI